MDRGLKIAISGKGGVGKTTLAAALALLFARDGQRVLAVDADPDSNLGTALGFTEEELATQRTIAEDRDLIKERTGATPDRPGQWFTLNPRVDDIPDTYVIEKDGVRLLRLGHVPRGGAGCDCPQNAFLRHLLRHLVVQRTDTVVVDMEAGLEHLGRGTTAAVDALIVVVEPGRRSFQTAAMTVRFARDLGVRRVFAVANKVRPGDEAAVEAGMWFLPLLGMLPYDSTAVTVDLAGGSVRQLSREFWAAVEDVKARLEGALTSAAQEA
ncbi:MAG: AAA family ATPase [Symbiobacteriaceae bacterium]